MKALLIIDMQNECFKPETPRFDTEGTIRRINQLSDHFRSVKQPVIFIQHDGSAQNFCQPGSFGWKILPGLNKKNEDLVIAKSLNDAFFNSELDATLKRLGVDTLYITGCATDFCVDATLKTALQLGYNIVVVKDGHTTGNRLPLRDKEVIDYYNWLWPGLIPLKKEVYVLSVREIIAS